MARTSRSAKAEKTTRKRAQAARMAVSRTPRGVSRAPKPKVKPTPKPKVKPKPKTKTATLDLVMVGSSFVRTSAVMALEDGGDYTTVYLEGGSAMSLAFPTPVVEETLRTGKMPVTEEVPLEPESESEPAAANANEASA